MENDKITAQDEASSDLAGSTNQPMTNSYDNDVSNSNFGQSQVAQPNTQIAHQSVPVNPIDSSAFPNQTSTKLNGVNPITVIMQWLTYAFWGWTAIAILVIASMILSFYLIESDLSDSMPYSIASVLVLLPISVICDFIYRKKEPAKKTGAYSVVMVIHAVIFALCFVGALVTLVLSLIQLLIGTEYPSFVQIWIYSAIIMIVVYAVMFFRTIIPEKLFKFRFYTVIFISLISIIMVVMGFVGPVADSMRTKNDRLIVDNLSKIANGISEYIIQNGNLPSSLENVSLDGEAKTIVSKNLVKYINEGESTDGDDDNYFSSRSRKSYKYQLCVDYIKSTITSRNNSSFKEYDDYSEYLNIYSHPDGEVCYKLKAYAD